MIVLTAKTLYTPTEQIERPLVFVDGTQIVEVTSRDARAVPHGAQLVDFGDAILVPGFVDIHIHGAAGHDVMDLGPHGLCEIESLLAAHGVTSYVPTTITAPLDATLAAVDRLASAIEATTKDTQPGRAVPVGIHLEGPFLSHVRPGVHPPEHLITPDVRVFEKLWEAARGHVRVLTIAPELPGAEEVIQTAAARGICVSVGHSDADQSTTRNAAKAGARHATHIFNAMRPLGHRDPGILGEVLTNPQFTADMIADGIHLDPAIVCLVARLKGPGATVLITDSLSATGMPDGQYRLGPLAVEVKDGRCTSRGTLAGSVLTMERAIANLMEFSGWGLRESLQAATINPARVTGLHDRGILKASARADLVVLGESGKVKEVMVSGSFRPGGFENGRRRGGS